MLFWFNLDVIIAFVVSREALFFVKETILCLGILKSIFQFVNVYFSGIRCFREVGL